MKGKTRSVKSSTGKVRIYMPFNQSSFSLLKMPAVRLTRSREKISINCWRLKTSFLSSSDQPQQRQEIKHSLLQIALVTVFGKSSGAVPFAELAAVRSEDKGHMGK